MNMISPEVTRVIRSVDKLQPLPTSVTRVLRAIDDPMTTAGMLSEIIGLDQALSANLLQLANSASLGYGPTCSTLADAVMRLGYKKVRTMVLSIGASSLLSRLLYGYRFGAGKLWNHSVATAVAAQWLSRTLSYPEPEEAYIAGLLHDIGKLLLDQFVLIDYKDILYSLQNDHKLLTEIEEERIGVNHAKVGSLMAEKWNFPPTLVEAIYCHHTPSLAFNEPRLAAIVNIANMFGTTEAIGLMDIASSVVHPDSLQILHLQESDIERLQKAMIAATHTHSS
jgi:putative nucleotidyltransferase with HDIG domain